jgi:hypothetical protein
MHEFCCGEALKVFKSNLEKGVKGLILKGV